MGPFVKSKNKTSKIMLNLLIALLPIVCFTFYKNGIVPYQKGYIGIIEMFYPLMFILVGILSSLLTEEIYLYVFNKKRGKDLIDAVLNGYAIFPGLFLSLVLPLNTPLSVLFLGSIVSIVIGKMLFGGFGNNIFNPALVGCIFVITCYGTIIGSRGGYLNSYELDAIGSATPLTNVSLVDKIGSYETLVKPYGSLLNFFIGTIPGAVGETSALLCILAFIYLSITKTIKWRIPLTYISTVFILTFIIGSLNNVGIWYPLFQILSGGLLFGSIFMATDPVTSPVNKEAQILYGLFLGIITTFLRYQTSYPEGVMTSILLMNMFVFILDRNAIKYRFNKKRYLLIIIITIILGLLMSYFISTGYKEEQDDIDPNYNVLSKEKINNQIVYEVSQKGFGGKIKAKIVFEGDSIVLIEVLDHNESSDRYKLITDQDYIKKLIKEQKNIKDVDAVSSATITSNALKNMVLNTVKDFKNNTDLIEKEDVKEEKTINIINEEKSGDAIIYTVEFDSFGGVMTLEVVMVNNNIKTIKPVSYKDTCVSIKNSNPYYTCPQYLEDNFINSLIKNQNNLDSVDTVSGATISSSAIKKAIIEMKEVD